MSFLPSLRPTRNSRFCRLICLLEPSHPEFKLTGLKAASVIKLDKLATVDTSILFGQLGELPPSLHAALDDCLRFALELQ